MSFPNGLYSCPNYEKMDVTGRWELIKETYLRPLCVSKRIHASDTEKCVPHRCLKCQRLHTQAVHCTFLLQGDSEEISVLTACHHDSAHQQDRSQKDWTSTTQENDGNGCSETPSDLDLCTLNLQEVPVVRKPRTDPCEVSVNWIGGIRHAGPDAGLEDDARNEAVDTYELSAFYDLQRVEASLKMDDVAHLADHKENNQGMLDRSCPYTSPLSRQPTCSLRRPDVAAYQSLLDGPVVRERGDGGEDTLDVSPPFYATHRRTVNKAGCASPFRIKFNGTLPSSASLVLYDVLVDPPSVLYNLCKAMERLEPSPIVAARDVCRHPIGSIQCEFFGPPHPEDKSAYVDAHDFADPAPTLVIGRPELKTSLITLDAEQIVELSSTLKHLQAVAAQLPPPVEFVHVQDLDPDGLLSPEEVSEEVMHHIELHRGCPTGKESNLQHPEREATQISSAQALRASIADRIKRIIWGNRKRQHRPNRFIAYLRNHRVNLNPSRINLVCFGMTGPIKACPPHARRPLDVIAGVSAILVGLGVRAVGVQLCEGFRFKSFDPLFRVFLVAEGLPSEIYTEDGGMVLASEAWVRGLLGNDDGEQSRVLPSSSSG